MTPDTGPLIDQQEKSGATCARCKRWFEFPDVFTCARCSLPHCWTCLGAFESRDKWEGHNVCRLCREAKIAKGEATG